MTPNELWNVFTAALANDDVAGMRDAGGKLRDHIDATGEWPTSAGRSEVYHHLNLALEISGGGSWKLR